MPVALDPSDSIAAAIAHEVNNLLTPVIGLADLLEHTGGDPEIRDQLIERAVERCQRAVAICGLLVDIAKDNRSGAPVCSLAGGLASVVSIAQTSADRSGVRLECCFDEPGGIGVPAIVVEHVLLNLVLNAIAASPVGAAITISADYAPGTTWRHAAWCVKIQDRGRGLDARNTASINNGGLPMGSTGIGLAVVRLLCQRWGGELRVESELGLGSTFHVKLPAA